VADVRLQVKDRLKAAWGRINTRENRWALALCLIVILLVILTADQSPQWIYQGF
jgi:hypothetical protein